MLEVNNLDELLEVDNLSELKEMIVLEGHYVFVGKNVVIRYPEINNRRDPVEYDRIMFRCEVECHNLHLMLDINNGELQYIEHGYSRN